MQIKHSRIPLAVLFITAIFCLIVVAGIKLNINKYYFGANLAGTLQTNKIYQPTAEYPSAKAKALSLVDTKNASSVNNLQVGHNSIISSTSLAQVKTTNADYPQQLTTAKGYIVELTNQSLSTKYKAILDSATGLRSSSTPTFLTNAKATLQAQKTKILSQQNSFLSSLSPAIKEKNKTVVSSNKAKSFHTVLNAVVLDVNENQAVALSKLPDVKSVEPVQVVHATLMDSVPLINAPQVWSGAWEGGVATTGKGITIAIIDTGVDYSHPDLGGCFGPKIVNGKIISCKVAGGYDFVNNDPDPMDDMGHGTHVASIAGGSGALKGVAPDATIYAYKVLDNNGSGYSDNIIAGLEAAVDPNYDGDIFDHLDIASLSIGGMGDPDDDMSKAVDNAVNDGVVVVVAAGNSGSGASTIGSPGTARNAITVGATDKYDNLANFSSRGPVSWTTADGSQLTLIKPDVVAPGVNICAAHWGDSFAGQGDTNCNNDNTHIALSGTSMATPHVAGEAALILQLHPDWSPAEIKATIRNNTVQLGSGSITNTGYGRINTLSAVQLIRPPVAQLAPLSVGKGVISIKGTATDFQNYSGYTLAYQYGSNPTWFNEPFYISDLSSGPVLNGVLAPSFDTTNFDDGIYTIKLTVTDKFGNTSVDEGQLNINNMEVTSVGSNLNYVNGGVQQISGSISYSAISSYKVVADDPKNGTKLCSGTSFPTGSSICSADFSNLSNGIHQLFLEVSQNGKTNIDTPFKISVVKELLDNWPQEIDGFPMGIQSIVGTDGNQSKKQLITPKYTSCGPGCGGFPILYDFYLSDGSHKLLSSLKDGSDIPLDYMPSAFYDNALKTESIVAVNSGNYIDNNGGVANTSDILKSDGSVISSWRTDDTSTQNSSPAIIFDRDNNGTPEIYNINFDDRSYFYPDNYGIRIMGHDFEGNLLPNYPVTIPTDTYPRQILASKHVSFLKSQAGTNMMAIVGDYSQAQMGESDLKLYAHIFSSDNKLLKSTLLYDGIGKSVGIDLPFSVSADLNGDGKTEAIIGYSIVDYGIFYQNIFDPNAYTTYIEVLDSDGNIIASADPIKGYEIGYFTPGSLAIGNLGKSNPSIVAELTDTWPTTYQGNRIMAFDGLLKPIFDVSEQTYNITNDIISGISIGDVNGDGKSEIVSNYRPRYYDGSPSGILIFNNQGSLLKNVEIPTMGAVDDYSGSPVVLDDFNNDGRIDAVLQSTFLPSDFHGGFGNSYITRLYALDLGGSYNASTVNWKTMLGDDQHTGYYEGPIPLSVVTSVTPSPGVVNQAVTFSAIASGGVGPYTGAWGGVLGGACTGTGSTCSKTFGFMGDYKANVKVTDATGSVVSGSASVTVNPILSATASASPNPATVNQPVTFTATPLGGAAPYTYKWTGNYCTGTNQTCSKTFSSAGNYPVTVKVTDSKGTTATASASVAVNPLPLTVMATALPNLAVTNQNVTFTATPSGGTTPYTYSWFGCTSTTATCTTPFAKAGNSIASVKVTDAKGNTASGSATVAVNAPLVTTATVSPNPAIINQQVIFTVTPSGGMTPYTYLWSGNCVGTTSTCSNTFASTGTYISIVKVTDAKGTVVTAGPSVTIILPLKATVSILPSSPKVNQAVTFTATSSGGTAPYTYSWSGDCVSATQTCSKTFATAKTYMATVKVTDAKGLTYSTSTMATVR